MAESPDNAGVRFPPPLLYVIAVVGGYVLNRRWPLPIGRSLLIGALAWTLLLSWLGLTVTSIGNFRRSRTSLVPIRPATALVLAGPYRFTRNPMYLGLAALTVALALLMNTWWVMLLLVPVLLAMTRFVITPEERYLRRRFGADYDAYTRRVRRWI